MVAPLAISLPRLRTHLEALSRFGRNPDGRGITRSCWSPAHEEARAWLLGRMKEAGLSTWVDEAGNTFGRLGNGGPSVVTGSHIDTVPNGGPLDGALGVLAGLECLQTIHESGGRTRRPLMVAAWSDEEGRYAGLFGSRAFAGKLDVKQIPRLRAADGERLVDAMARAGFNPYDAPKARCNPKTLSAYVELHIEQGPHLEAAKIPIGVVEGIVGNRRNWVTFTGQADHAGTTPMAWRRDAFMAGAEYALRARRLIVAKGSGRSVTNFGRVEVGPGVSNIVPDRCVLLHECSSSLRRAGVVTVRTRRATGGPSSAAPTRSCTPCWGSPDSGRRIVKFPTWLSARPHVDSRADASITAMRELCRP